MSEKDLALRRVRWRCRRGLLENDLMLERFLARHAHELDAAELLRLQQLLELEDHDLWEVLSGVATCADPALQAIVERIRAD